MDLHSSPHKCTDVIGFGWEDMTATRIDFSLHQQHQHHHQHRLLVKIQTRFHATFLGILHRFSVWTSLQNNEFEQDSKCDWSKRIRSYFNGIALDNPELLVVDH